MDDKPSKMEITVPRYNTLKWLQSVSCRTSVFFAVYLSKSALLNSQLCRLGIKSLKLAALQASFQMHVSFNRKSYEPETILCSAFNHSYILDLPHFPERGKRSGAKGEIKLLMAD